jgi:sugar lactone lactonase YvrE
MRPILHFAFAVWIGLSSWWAALTPRVYTANLDATADRVFGQPDFSSNTPNHGGLGANSLYFPGYMALDSKNNLYVADTVNNRVLEYDSPLTTDTVADRVFGQPDFKSNTINNGGVSANSLFLPGDVALDDRGDLYVADTNNNRVLVYDAPLTSDTTADRVFGQPDFKSNTINNGGVSAQSLYSPNGLALDAQGDLYVADIFNHRVLEYNTPRTTDTSADRVFGQPDFSANAPNNGGVSATCLEYPEYVALDAHGNLYVVDTQNNRALEYDAPLTTDTTADRVFGQPDFSSNTPNKGGLSANSLNNPYGLALDAQGDLYVADTGNHRVLEYDIPLTTDTTADRVFGQPDFKSNTINNGGVSAESLSNPAGLALDAQGDLYVADTNNNRVLEYDPALARILLPVVVR